MQKPPLPEFDVTPEFVAFLRAEFEIVMSFDDLSGVPWNNSSVAAAITNSSDLPGTIPDERIRRFRNPNSKNKPSYDTLMTLTGFLIHSGYVPAEDFKAYSQPGFSRAATSIAQLFANDASAQSLRSALVGEFRHFQRYGNQRLLESTLVVASPDDGQSLVASERRTVYFVEDFEWLSEEPETLRWDQYARIPELLEHSEAKLLARTFGRGVAAATSQIFTVLFGGENLLSHSVLNIDEVALDEDGQLLGLKCTRLGDWVKSVGGNFDPLRQTDQKRSLWQSRFGDLVFYPQGKRGLGEPKFATASSDMRPSSTTGGGFGFARTPQNKVDEEPNQSLEAQRVERKIEEMMNGCKDVTQRLFLAMDLFRDDYAIKAIEEGADANARHPAHGLPAIHCAASVGMRTVVHAMLATGVCDLTVRDQHNRLASTCADNCAEDFELRDKLIKAQTEQFRERGLDPRRPTVPDYGSYTLS